MKAALVALAVATALTAADRVPLTLVPSGGMHKFGRFMPIHLDLSPTRPESLRKAPPLSKPMYGLLDFGGKKHIAILDEQPTGLKLYLDANGNGDLTDEPPANWQTSQYPAQDKKQYTLNRGTMVVNLATGKEEISVSLGVYKFDKADPDHADLVDTLLYYCDYASEGQMTLDGKSYHVVIVDWVSSGYATGTHLEGGKPVDSGFQLAIDVNNNGTIDARGERFDALEPFNIGGTTYKIAKIDATGFEFEKSTKPVAAVPLPPALGDKAPSFTAETLDGGSIPFPSRYRGKLVMLFFWSIADEHSTKEIPGLVKAYAKYHPQGFEVLGISSYLPDGTKDPAQYVKEHNMPWLEISEHYPSDATVTNLFAVRYLPAAFLVDGDTGKIVATVDSLRGDKLAPTIEKALAAKRGK